MPAYRLAVIVAYDGRCYPDAPENTVNVEHVFTVEVPRALAWVREHADELAREALPGAEYVALNISEH